MWANYIGVMNESASASASAWEEEAFRALVWPPTSYSCSFCTREFRSAQALGGHMNIHRRERARLRQSLNPTTMNNPPQNPSLSSSPNPSFSSSPTSRVSLTQRTLCNNSADTRNTSCVSSLELHGAAETNFNLGFRLDSNTTNHHHHRGGFGHDDVINCKRQKTTVMPLIVGSIEEVDLELRLAT